MKGALLWGALTSTVVILALASMTWGSTAVGLMDLLSIDWDPDARDSTKTILLQLRLPRSLTAILGGAGLALAGLMMQTLFRNALAGPGVLGISSGAGLGVALVLLGGAEFQAYLGGGWWESTMVTAAFAGAMSVLGVVLFFSTRVTNSVSLLIIGLMTGYVASSLISVLTYFSTAEQIQGYALWGMGSFSGAHWTGISILALVTIPVYALVWSRSSHLDLMLMGDRYAHSMGLGVKAHRALFIFLTAMLVGSVTAFCGPVAFLGLAVPHICRRLLSTSRHVYLVPACFLVGAALALSSDLVARVPGSDITLPLNTITALIGAPVVIAFVLRRQKWSF
jgi:iron complex transport system permease protein